MRKIVMLAGFAIAMVAVGCKKDKVEPVAEQDPCSKCGTVVFVEVIEAGKYRVYLEDTEDCKSPSGIYYSNTKPNEGDYLCYE